MRSNRFADADWVTVLPELQLDAGGRAGRSTLLAHAELRRDSRAHTGFAAAGKRQFFRFRAECFCDNYGFGNSRRRPEENAARRKGAAKNMATTEKALRESVIAHGARVVEAGLGGAPAGDISARFSDKLLITPSGTQYAALRPAMIAAMPLGGEYGAWKGPMKPSGEWRIHLDVARARPDVGAIIRFQSPYATALAMTRTSIPAAHSMIALFGAAVIRCTKYAPPRRERAGRPDCRSARGRPCRAARQLRRADDRRDAGDGARAGHRARSARQALCDRFIRRTSGDPLGRGSCARRRAPENFRGGHRGADRRAARAGQEQDDGQTTGQDQGVTC